MRLYRALLWLFPASFRNEYGDEMRLVFSDRRRAASGSGVLVLWLDVITDTLRNAAQVHWDVLRQDLRYTTRGWTRSPGFAMTAIVVSGLGIGATTAVFSLADQVFLRPLPYADAERLVKIWEHVPGYSRLEPSPANYRDWKLQSESFESMAGFHGSSANLIGEGEPVRLQETALEPHVFSMLGAAPQLGRLLVTEDAAGDSADAVLLSHGLWQSIFGGRQDIVGQTVRLGDRLGTIVGVMPASFRFPNRDVDIWTPRRFTEDDFSDRDNNYLHVIAKLRRGTSIDEARSEMEVVAERMEAAYPDANAETRANVVALWDEVPDRSRVLLIALLGASLCVLLIACTNLANVLLARALERRAEVTVRTALGGGPDRLLRQLLTESLVLSTLGGVLGIAVAIGLSPILTRLVPTRLPVAEASAVDVRVLCFAAALTFVTGIGFGVLPALRARTGIDFTALREGARSALGTRRDRLRSVLVVAQIAASIVLLVASALLMRALWRVQSVDPGFATTGVVALETPLPRDRYGETLRRAAFYERVLDEVRAIPGVSDAAFTSFLPMQMKGGIWPVRVDGVEDGGVPESASLRFATPRLFSTMKIPLRRGRDIEDTDTFEAPFVAVVSESFVARYWPDTEPLGRTFHFAFRDRIVVGVVGDVRVRGLEGDSEPQVYLPHRQAPDGALLFYAPKELVVRAGDTDFTVLPAVRRAVRRADPELPIHARPLEDIVARETSSRSTQILVLGIFSGLSLVLSGVGIYGLLAFAVSRRRNEIGVRMALGARPAHVLGMVLGEGLVLSLVGVCVGGVLAFLAGRSMEAVLAGVQPTDATSFVMAAAVALVMTLAGSLVPALKAVAVDPTTALRAEG